MDDTAVVAISTSNHRPWIRKMANAAVKRRKRRSRWRAYDCTETVARIAAKPANETLRNTSRGPIYPRNDSSSVRYFAYDRSKVSRGARKSGSRHVLTSSPSGPKSPYRGSDTSWWREDGTDARAFLAKAAATFTVLSLLPVALSGFAPSHASPVLRPISDFDLGGVPVGDIPWPAALFAAFTYDRGLVLGTYARFAYNSTSGGVTSLFGGVVGDLPVSYLESIAIDGFPPARSAAAHGPIFEADGYLVTLTAHDDPTGLIEIRSEMARGVTIELPASAANISLLSASGQARASTVSFTIQGEEARLFLGSGSFNVTGTRVVAEMASPDLLVFKSVPAASTNKAEWRAVLDAISAGQVVAELDLIATADGHWMQNPARYRIDVAAWPLAGRPRAASVPVDTLRPGGARILLSFYPAPTPTGRA